MTKDYLTNKLLYYYTVETNNRHTKFIVKSKQVLSSTNNQKFGSNNEIKKKLVNS